MNYSDQLAQLRDEAVIVYAHTDITRFVERIFNYGGLHHDETGAASGNRLVISQSLYR